ncbi:MAG: hypothetical protein MZU91_00835 [Desulfosudis oleivorans]|nr:hypothetical protein [Desulfosudis oleivorans]
MSPSGHPTGPAVCASISTAIPLDLADVLLPARRRRTAAGLSPSPPSFTPGARSATRAANVPRGPRDRSAAAPFWA